MDGIVIFPNSSVEVDGDTVWTTEPVQKFVSCVGENQKVILAASSVPYKPSSRQNAILSRAAWFPLFSPGKARCQTTHFRQVIGYVTAFIRMLFRVPKKPLWYVFLWGHMGTLACLVCCLLRKRFGIYVRNEWPQSGITGALYRWYFKRAAFIFATGSSFTDTLRQFNDHVKEVAPMMLFCAEDLREKPSYEVVEMARILYVGAIDRTKGVFEAVRTLPDVAKQCNVELKIVGTGDSEITRDLQAEIQAGGCADRIELVGHVGDKRELAKWFASADVFVFPTYYKEGFPRVVYEAMGFGLPVICTDIDGGKLFLRDRENCRLVPKRDVDGLTKVLIELLADQSLRTAIGKRAFLDSRELFTRFEGISHGGQVEKAICDMEKKAATLA